MASCTKCGATLVATARFCAACGSPVGRGSRPPPLPKAKTNPDSFTDPFAKTMMGESGIPEMDGSVSPAPSPLASSLMAGQNPPARPTASPFQPPAQPAAQPRTAERAAASPFVPQARASQAPPAYAPQQQAYAQPQQPAQQAPQSPYFVPGTMVLVYWSDGNRYPGTVLQVAPQYLLIAFPNGSQQWVDLRYVTVGQ